MLPEKNVTVISALLDTGLVASGEADRDLVASVLHAFPLRALEALQRNGTRIVCMASGTFYRNASPAIERMGINVDSWPAPPAGLFVVEERTLYVRSRSRMTIAHELGHALDCALGGGVYRSGLDPRVREAYGAASSFVTPYACTSLDEYFAECVRAYVDVNDPASAWPKATRAILKRIDPTMLAYLDEAIGDAAEVAA